MLPLSMITGGIFYDFFGGLSFITPYLIFCMLLITFCKLSLRDIRISHLHLWLIAIQIFGSLLVFWLFYFIDPVVAEGAFICILAPTATAAAVITGMLGGRVSTLATYSLVSSLSIAFVAPVIFSFIGTHSEMEFVDSFLYIFKQVGSLLILPFVCALLLQKTFPSVHRKLYNAQMLSFYMWSVSLAVVTGKTVSFIAAQNSANYQKEIWIACCALVICVSQFILGRHIGRHYNNTVAGGQGLGQKNTILAIWMAQVYLNPLASIGPASYVLWQNIINSYQLWKKRKNDLVA